MDQALRERAAGGVLVAVVGLGLAGCCCPSSKRSSSGTSNPDPTPTTATPREPGRCGLREACWVTDSDIVVFASETDYDEASAAAGKGDTLRFAELAMRGRQPKVGTKVQVTELGFEGCELVILEGPHALFRGWTLNKMLQDRCVCGQPTDAAPTDHVNAAASDDADTQAAEYWHDQHDQAAHQEAAGRQASGVAGQIVGFRTPTSRHGRRSKSPVPSLAQVIIVARWEAYTTWQPRSFATVAR